MGVTGIHFDVMDGVFVPRLGLYPELMEAIRSETKLPIEVHLMVSNCKPYIRQLVLAGATRLIIHIETLKNPLNVISLIKDLGIEVGIALNPETNIETLQKVLGEIDLVLIMAINPGVPKHPFIPSTFHKLVSLKKYIDQKNFNTKIGIDGGVTFENVITLFENGADMLVCGSGTIFRSGNTMESNLITLTSLIGNKS